MQYYDKDIQSKFPNLVNYFKNGIIDENKSIGHLLLFWGPDIKAQGALANEIARMLNCSQTKEFDCNCVNCEGIRENRHEAFKIYTRLDFKDSSGSTSEGDNSNKGKKNITIEQAKTIINDISLTSIYHRVYVFCDRDSEWNLLPLNKFNFPDATANALLKTFEEPTMNSTFIILTTNPTDVISTVVSRAQTFFVPSFKAYNYDYSKIENVFENYWEMSKEEVFSFSDKVYSLATENDSKDIFIEIQNYMYSMAYENFENKVIFYKFIKDIHLVEKAIRQISLTPAMALRNVVDNLCYKLILG